MRKTIISGLIAILSACSPVGQTDNTANADGGSFDTNHRVTAYDGGIPSIDTFIAQDTKVDEKDLCTHSHSPAEKITNKGIEIYCCKTDDWKDNTTYILAKDIAIPHYNNCMHMFGSDNQKLENVVLDCQGRTIKNTNKNNNTAGIAIIFASNVEVRNCIVDDQMTGFSISTSKKVNLNKNTTRNSTHSGLQTFATHDTKTKKFIHNGDLYLTDHKSFSDSTGINETGGSRVFIEGGKIEDATTGIATLPFHATMTIDGMLFEKNSYTAVDYSHGNLKVTKAHFSHNKIGLLVKGDGKELEVSESYFTNNLNGLFLWKSSGQYDGNTFGNNTYSIILDLGHSGKHDLTKPAHFNNNNFCGDSLHVADCDVSELVTKGTAVTGIGNSYYSLGSTCQPYIDFNKSVKCVTK